MAPGYNTLHDLARHWRDILVPTHRAEIGFLQSGRNEAQPVETRFLVFDQSPMVEQFIYDLAFTLNPFLAAEELNVTFVGVHVA